MTLHPEHFTVGGRRQTRRGRKRSRAALLECRLLAVRLN
jgi:hypothetical protein